MSRRAWALLAGGVLVGALGAALLESVLKARLADVETRLSAVDRRQRELAAVKAPVDAYERDRARFEEQLRAIDEERARQRCPGLLLAELALERRAALIDALSLDGTTLALVGRAESDADMKALAASLREAKWARAVRAGSAAGGPGHGLRFGFLITVDLPACPVSETPVAAPAAPPAEEP